MFKFSDLTIGVAVANRSEAMEAETISKNGRNLKSQKSRKNFLNYLVIAVFAISASFTSCGGGSGSGGRSSSTPSGVCEKLLSALVKKDYKTAASYLYTYGTGYSIEDNAKLFEEDFSYFGISKYKFQNEQISADGKKATVIFNITYIDNENTKEEAYDKDFQLIKTESEGWKIEGDGRTLF